MSTESSTIDSKLAQGIAYFEQMLLVMPDDRQALEFLCVAYEQIGDTDKRRTALVALAGVLLKEGDIDSAERIGERLADYNTADVQEMLQKINRARHPNDGTDHPRRHYERFGRGANRRNVRRAAL